MNITLNKNYRFILMPRAMLTSFLPDLANNKYSVPCPGGKPRFRLYQFLVAAVSNCHEMGIRKERMFIFLQFWKVEGQN